MHVRSPDPVASPPRAVIRLLGGAATSHDAGRAARSPSAITRWAAAVALGGVGHYARAAGVLEGLRRDPAVDPGLRAHALVTRASHLRQLGGHAAATPLDGRAARLARGLGCPVGPDDPWGTGAGAAVADALTGLAADALGRFDAARAAVLLDRAGPWCGAAGSRTRVRHDWVSAETALVAGDAGAALVAADRALAGARTLGSDRHVLKSRLVRAVAAGVAGEDPSAVLAELDAVAADALATGMVPLHRPALLAAADLADRHPPERVGAVVDPDDGEVLSRSGHGTAEQGMNNRAGASDAAPRHAGESRFDTRSRRAGAEGRRHAALHTVSVLYTRSDGPGRELLRE
ncbi:MULTISPECIES: hypothetical protein [unclassified Pseudonocardia]|uniref:hypothetical protein n=1 Tax=unclassified Pseudonocardia TaxID=2619320 RepID=UPI0007621260|nr:MULTISPECIES: hypothetical protein [unclassified Pseudonocardia]